MKVWIRWFVENDPDMKVHGGSTFAEFKDTKAAQKYIKNLNQVCPETSHFYVTEDDKKKYGKEFIFEGKWYKICTTGKMIGKRVPADFDEDGQENQKE